MDLRLIVLRTLSLRKSLQPLQTLNTTIARTYTSNPGYTPRYGLTKFRTNSNPNQFRNNSNPNNGPLGQDQFQVEPVQKHPPGRAFLNELTSGSLPKSPLNWPSLLSQTMEIDISINEKNFGGLLIMFCIKNRNYDLATEFIKYKKDNLTISILSGYLRLSTELGKASESQLLEMYSKLKSLNKNMWDLETGERTIIALCKTSKWRDSYEILESMKIGGNPSALCYSLIATAAFNEKQFKEGWDILNTVGYRKPAEDPFIAWLQLCPLKEENVNKVLEYFDLYEIYPSSDLMDEIKNFFKKLGYNPAESGVYRGSCKICKTPLDRSILTPEEFKLLSDHFFNKVLLENDVFLNSNPKEVQDYKYFIEDNGPFDYVLDGLNISLACGRSKPQAVVLEHVVRSIYEGQNRILVIGRKHMSKWPRSPMSSILKMAKVYLIENSSQDDPFLIWATLKGGMRAKFVSKDLMRNHTFRLNDFEMGRLFKRWRLSHQLGVSVGQKNGRVRMDPFTEIVPSPQKNGSFWHVPYGLERLASPYDLPDRWVCFKKRME